MEDFLLSRSSPRLKRSHRGSRTKLPTILWTRRARWWRKASRGRCPKPRNLLLWKRQVIQVVHNADASSFCVSFHSAALRYCFVFFPLFTSRWFWERGRRGSRDACWKRWGCCLSRSPSLLPMPRRTTNHHPASPTPRVRTSNLKVLAHWEKDDANMQIILCILFYLFYSLF